jgi:hypothetical protein
MSLCRMCESPLDPHTQNTPGDQPGDMLFTTVVFPNIKTHQGSGSLSGRMVCPDCGMAANVGWIFCPGCGKKVDLSFIGMPLPSDQALTVPAMDSVPRNLPGQSFNERPATYPAPPQAPVQQPIRQPLATQPPFQSPLPPVQQTTPPVAKQPDKPQAVPIDQAPTQKRLPDLPYHANASFDDVSSTVKQEIDFKKPVVSKPAPVCEAVLLCLECGFENDSDSFFCAECGTGLPVNKTVAMSQVAPRAEARLRLLTQGNAPGRVYELKDDTSIGRNQGDITFPHDAFLSTKHARIIRRGDDFFLVDDKSHNGTFMKIESEVKLKPGAVILVGRQLFRFEA